MARPEGSGEDRHTPGPWLVCDQAKPGAPAAERRFGVALATSNQLSGGPYLVRRDHPVALGSCPLPIATGIQRLPDARLIAAAPDLAAALLRLLTTRACTAADLDQHTRGAVEAGWALLVRVTPNLEVWP